jgi:hypothetical protein
MYGLTKDIDLAFLNGREVGQIPVGTMHAFRHGRVSRMG